jgi:hypothetical protein
MRASVADQRQNATSTRGTAKNSPRVAATVEEAETVIYRATPQRPTSADVAVGIGHELMDAEAIGRGLARIATKGVRTAKVHVRAGIPVVMTKDLPVGVMAFLLADRIEARRIETNAVVVTVERAAIPAMAGGHPVRMTAEEEAANARGIGAVTTTRTVAARAAEGVRMPGRMAPVVLATTTTGVAGAGTRTKRTTGTSARAAEAEAGTTPTTIGTKRTGRVLERVL